MGTCVSAVEIIPGRRTGNKETWQTDVSDVHLAALKGERLLDVLYAQVFELGDSRFPVERV